MQFSVQKELRLKKEDLSKKGSIDSKIIELIDYINAQDCYFSTSSCSGRTSVFTDELKKKGLEWIFISHEMVDHENVIAALKLHSGSAVLKFEPFVLHVQCSTIEDAQKLHLVALESGFKNSGLSISKKGRIIAAIRSSLTLETPLSCNGVVWVSNEFISYVVSSCNQKMEENWQRIERFFSGLKKAMADSNEISKEKVKPYKKHESNWGKNEIQMESESVVDTFCDSFMNMLNQETT